jgi:DNA-binding response OmpR family regulator
VLGIVAQALNGEADVVSVATVDDARRALAASGFDLLVLDISLGGSSGLELLPELHKNGAEAIPIIVYSAQGENPIFAAKVEAALKKSRPSIDSLIAMLRKQVAPPFPNRPVEGS